MSEANADKATRRFSYKRAWPLVVLVGGLGLFFAFGLDQYVSFEKLHEHRAELAEFVANYGAIAMLTYTLAYVAVVAISLPGGLIMTLLGGFLFGTVLGGGLAVLGASIGATALFLAARTALADPLRARAGPIMRKMEDGIREDALYYLFFLRLVPVFPFFLVNLAAGILGMKLRDYLIATFLGIIPGGMVYASVGNGLGAILDAGEKPDLGIIFRPEILLPLIGLAVLALVPVVCRHLKQRQAARRGDEDC